MRSKDLLTTTCLHTESRIWFSQLILIRNMTLGKSKGIFLSSFVSAETRWTARFPWAELKMHHFCRNSLMHQTVLRFPLDSNSSLIETLQLMSKYHITSRIWLPWILSVRWTVGMVYSLIKISSWLSSWSNSKIEARFLLTTYRRILLKTRPLQRENYHFLQSL